MACKLLNKYVKVKTKVEEERAKLFSIKAKTLQLLTFRDESKEEEGRREARAKKKAPNEAVSAFAYLAAAW